MRIVYGSCTGRYADSPAAVHRALLRRGDEHEHVWLRDPKREGGFPPGTSVRDLYTPEAVEALESADLVISDSHLEMEWVKRPGARYVQTWHGTPLKRVHHDVLSPPPGVLEWLTLDVDRWDVLLSPNSYSTGALRSAFRWEGPVLEIGYPRNDVLLGPDADRVRRRVRGDLGITDDQKVILYTPTWRDDVFWERGADAPTQLALDAAAIEELGPEFVVLVRLHYKLNGRPELPDHRGVKDVSGHPDVAELYLAADAMVTDYSSTMFDFAITGKPLIFYTYDLEYYRDELRGFYFELSDQAPGPLVTSQQELIAALRDLPSVAEKYADAYQGFQERFCNLEDGHATQRFLDSVIPLPTPRR